jgi:hypothetical protein
MFSTANLLDSNTNEIHPNQRISYPSDHGIKSPVTFNLLIPICIAFKATIGKGFQINEARE